jgi:hypothetical protein
MEKRLSPQEIRANYDPLDPPMPPTSTEYRCSLCTAALRGRAVYVLWKPRATNYPFIFLCAACDDTVRKEEDPSSRN